MKKRLLTYPIVAAFAFTVSHWIAVADEFDVCVTYKFESAGRNLLNAGELHHYLDSDVLHRIPAGESLVSDLPKEVRDDMWFRSFVPAGLTDPWGNPYCIVSERRGDLHWLGFYSTGADGVSDSKGNDPDDINSWGQDGSEHYLKAISRDERNRYIKKIALIFLLVAPISVLFYERTARTSASRDSSCEQPGAGQPATRPVVELEGGDKPQPEAEGRPR